MQPRHKAPIPSSQFSLRNGKDLSRARGLCAACEPLTDSFRSGTWIQRERGPGVSAGVPLAAYEAAPHARVARRPSPPAWERELGPCPQAPFPSSQLLLQNGGDPSRARRFGAACEPLTD